jgi:hypothetical protein
MALWKNIRSRNREETMIRVVSLLAVALLLFLGNGPPTAVTAEAAVPKPAARNAEPEVSPPVTPEGAERVRQESWKKPRIPGPKDIESITAEAYSNILPVADVPPFVLPKKYYSDLLHHFRDAEPDRIASTVSEELGTIRIALVGGRSVRICWFWSGQGDRLCFSWCGMRYRATGARFAKDETLAVDSLVRRIYQVEVLHKDGNSEPIWWPSQGRARDGRQ